MENCSTYGVGSLAVSKTSREPKDGETGERSSGETREEGVSKKMKGVRSVRCCRELNKGPLGLARMLW